VDELEQRVNELQGKKPSVAKPPAPAKKPAAKPKPKPSGAAGSSPGSSTSRSRPSGTSKT
ncbi:MAG: hypothetical protein ACJ76U_16470, partial [Gaiellaceae bacterium]